MGKKSDFEILKELENRRITMVSLVDGQTTVKSQEGEGDDVSQFSTSLPQYPSVEFEDALVGLKEAVIVELMGLNGKADKDRFYRSITIRKVTISHPGSCCKAKIGYLLQDKLGNHIKSETSDYALRGRDDDGGFTPEEAKVKTWSEHTTELLEELQKQAKLYLGGIRGQQPIPFADEGPEDGEDAA